MSTDQPHDDGTSLDIESKIAELLQRLQGDIKDNLFEQLNAGLAASDLDKAFVEAIQDQWKKRNAALVSDEVLSEVESELFKVINRSLSPREKERWDELVARRDAESLSFQEHDELIRLGNELDALNVSRLQAIGQLAKIRGVPFQGLCRQLEIMPS